LSGQVKPESALDLDQERAKLAEAQRKKLELHIAEKEYQLIPGDQVEETWLKIIEVTRSRVLSIPTKAAPLVFACKTVSEAHGFIKDAVYDALTSISTDIKQEIIGGMEGNL